MSKHLWVGAALDNSSERSEEEHFHFILFDWINKCRPMSCINKSDSRSESWQEFNLIPCGVETKLLGNSSAARQLAFSIHPQAGSTLTRSSERRKTRRVAFLLLLRSFSLGPYQSHYTTTWRERERAASTTATTPNRWALRDEPLGLSLSLSARVTRELKKEKERNSVQRAVESRKTTTFRAGSTAPPT